MFNIENFISNDNFLGSNAKLPEFDYNSFYRAYVVNTDDPEGLGRIRVRIPTLHGSSDNMNISELPYAYPACFTGLGNQVGPFYLPPIGSIVFVTFEYSEEHRIIYFGGIPTQPYDGKTQSYGTKINNGLPREITENDIPTEYTGSQAIVYKSPNGNILYFDDGQINKVVLQDAIGKYLEYVYYFNGETKVNYYKNHISDNSEIKVTEDTIYIKLNGKQYAFNTTLIDQIISGGGQGGPATWGNITGTLSNQTDLNQALNNKANKSEVYLKSETYTKEEVKQLIKDLISVYVSNEALNIDIDKPSD